MKKFYLGVFLALNAFIFGQSAEDAVDHFLIACGNDWSNPDDYATIYLNSYYGDAISKIDSVQASSVQDVFCEYSIDNESFYSFVIADTFLLRYNANFQRDTLIKIKGAQVLNVWNDFLIIGFGYGMDSTDTSFLKIYDKNTLELLHEFNEVDTDVSDVLVDSNKLYIAESGDWSATTGAISILDLDEISIDTTLQLDTFGHGITQLLYEENTNKIHALCKGGYGATTGYINSFHKDSLNITNSFINAPLKKFKNSTTETENSLNHIINKGFIGLNNKVALFNFETMSVDDSSYISSSYTAGMNVKKQIWEQTDITYITQTDYFSYGLGILFENGDTTQTSVLDISCEALSAKVTFYTGMEDLNEKSIFKVYPNPTSDYINIELETSSILLMTDVTGRTVKEENLFMGRNMINVKPFDQGIYFLHIDGYETQKIIIE
jgi:hypothetical protein